MPRDISRFCVEKDHGVSESGCLQIQILHGSDPLDPDLASTKKLKILFYIRIQDTKWGACDYTWINGPQNRSVEYKSGALDTEL